MAKKKPANTTQTFVFKGYVNINVPATLANACESRIGDIQWITQSMSQAIVDGLNLKIYWDDTAQHFRASFTGMSPTSENFGYVLSAYAGDWLTAIAVLCFKHFDVSGEDWSGFVQEEKGLYG